MHHISLTAVGPALQLDDPKNCTLPGQKSPKAKRASWPITGRHVILLLLLRSAVNVKSRTCIYQRGRGEPKKGLKTGTNRRLLFPTSKVTKTAVPSMSCRITSEPTLMGMHGPPLDLWESAFWNLNESLSWDAHLLFPNLRIRPPIRSGTYFPLLASFSFFFHSFILL